MAPSKNSMSLLSAPLRKILFKLFLRFPDVLADCTGAIDLVPVGLLFIRYAPRHGLA
jgi:hypothetical protein